MESMKRKKKIKDTIANIILAILVVLTLGPIVFMVLTSLMDHNAIARGKWIAPTRFSNYVEVLWLWRSFPGSGFFGILILATQLLPGMMFLLPLYLDFV